jgi:hypothetical protein
MTHMPPPALPQAGSNGFDAALFGCNKLSA